MSYLFSHLFVVFLPTWVFIYHLCLLICLSSYLSMEVLEVELLSILLLPTFTWYSERDFIDLFFYFRLF
jgi:hypothetical protein